MRRTSRPSPTAALGGGGGAQLVQPLPPAADPLGEARGALPGLRPIGRLPDRLSQGAPCTLTFWIGCKAFSPLVPSSPRRWLFGVFLAQPLPKPRDGRILSLGLGPPH